jgi:transcriptional regulator GlxA family with amidase domain
VTEDDGIVCSGGMYASIDLSLYLVEKLCGHDIALQCAKSLVVSLPRNLQSGYGVVPLSRTHADERVKQAEQLLQRAFDRNDVSVEQIAEQLAMSPRNLLRRFKAATGHLPANTCTCCGWRRRATCSKAEAPGAEGRGCVGYEDLASFRQIFKRHTGMTPADYRSRFGPLTVAHRSSPPPRRVRRTGAPRRAFG